MHQVFSDARWFMRGRAISFKEAIVDINRCHPGLSNTALRRELAAATFYFQRAFILSLETSTLEQRTRMLSALAQSQNDGLDSILDPEFNQKTAEQLWGGLSCHQFLGQIAKFISWSFTCWHKDCRNHSMGDLWLQTREEITGQGHFACVPCIRQYFPFKTSVALTPVQR